MVSLQLFSLFLKLLDLLFEIRKLILESVFSFCGFSLGCLLLELKLIFQSLLFSLELVRLLFSIVKLDLNFRKMFLLLLAVITASNRTILRAIISILALIWANIVGRFVTRIAFAVRISRVRAMLMIRKAGFTAGILAAFKMVLIFVVAIVTVAVAAILTVGFSLLLLLLYLITKIGEVVFDRF